MLSSNMSPEKMMKSTASCMAVLIISSRATKVEDLIFLPRSLSSVEIPTNLLPRCRSAQWMNLMGALIVHR